MTWTIATYVVSYRETEVQRNRQPLLPTWLSVLLSGAFILSGVVVAFFAYLTIQHLLGSSSGTATPLDGFIDQEGALQPVPGQQPPPAISVTQTVVAIAPTPAPTLEGWETSERINILLMGMDRRPGEAFVSRTDSMMVVSIDPKTNSASILSIPRDLYVQIPGYGQDRINTAFVYGAIENGDYLDGAALAMQTVSYNLGIPVEHFLMVDFGAFTRTIDLLGGIDVQVPYDINDPNYPDMGFGYEPLYIPAGLQHFDGATALKYARTRHSDSDFNRAYRQQQVLLAARQQAFNLGIGEMLRRLPSLYAEVQSGVRTDLSAEQIFRLATTASSIESENVRTGVLDGNYVTSYRTPGGASVLLLSQDVAMPFIQSLFAN
jgi:LCP family protein required for cell wall assembly